MSDISSSFCVLCHYSNISEVIIIIFLLDQSRKFANNSPLKSVCIYGGTSVPHQINQIKQGVNVLVATPGRLLDFLDKGFISFRYASNSINMIQWDNRLF